MDIEVKESDDTGTLFSVHRFVSFMLDGCRLGDWSKQQPGVPEPSGHGAPDLRGGGVGRRLRVERGEAEEREAS